jgi:hypothetical protein
MDHGQLSMVADKFQWVFSEALLVAPQLTVVSAP